MTDPNRYRDPLSGEAQADLDTQLPFSGMPNAPKVEAQPQDQEAEDIAALHHAEAQMYDEQQAQDSSADQLAAMRRASSITPEYAAYCDKLSADLDVPFNAVAHDKEAAKREADVPAWQQIARFAPKTSALLQEKPEVFHQVQDDAAALKDLEVFKSELKKNGVTDDEYNAATKTIFDPAESIKAELSRSLETGERYAMPSRSKSSFFTNLDAIGTQFTESAIQSMDIGARSVLNDAKRGLGITGYYEARDIQDQLAREYNESAFRSAQATPDFSDSLLPKTNEFMFGAASSFAQSAPLMFGGVGLKVLGVPLKIASALTLSGMFGQQSLLAYPKYRSRGGDVGEAALGSMLEGSIEVAFEKSPLGFAMEELGKMSVKNFAKYFASKEAIGEQGATFFGDLTDTLIANQNKTMAEFWQERPEAAVQTMFAVGMNTAAMASIQHIANTVMKYDGSYEANQKLNQEMEIVKKLQVAGLNTVRAKQILDNMDGDSAPDVYVDPQQLFNQEEISPQQFKNAMPNYSTQLDEALAVGGLLRMDKNELMLAMRNDEEGWASLSQHLKVDPAADSLYESAQSRDALTDELNKLADKRIAESKNEAEARDQWDALKEKARQRLADSGMDKEAIEQAATMDASVAHAFSTRTGLDAGDILSGQFGTVSRRLSGGEILGGVFNQGGIESVRQAWHGNGIDGQVFEKGDVITLSKIVVPDGSRGAGAGTQAMQQLIDYADANGKHVVLSPSADFGGNVKRLKNFYKRFGFVENKGRNRAFSTSESMYRQAQGKVLFQGGNYNENEAPDSLSDDAADALVELYQELGSNDDVFQYSRDDAKELDNSVLSAAPEGTKQIADDLVIEMAKEDAENAGQPAIVDVKKYVVPTKEVIVDANNKPILKDGKKQYKEHKRDAYVYVNELGEYWVDLSNLKRAGGVGGMIYTKVADFAAKNGGVFRGDPMGLSDDALLKRTEHMASGIARRKQSASFVPHDRQLNPYDEKHKNSPLNKHIRPIQWTHGNDKMNRREIVKTAFHNITQVMPELRHAWIDPDTGRILVRGTPLNTKFRDWVHELQKGGLSSDGQRRTDTAGAVAKQGEPLGAYRHLYASASIKRQLLANTLARYVGESAERRRQILDRLGEISKDLESYDGRKLFYQTKKAKPFDGKESDRARIAKRDAEYMAAVERGDMEAAQRLVNEAAAEAGYDPSTSERMSHAAPNSTDGISVNLADVRGSDLVPEDFWTHPKRYASDNREIAAHRNVMDVMRRVERKRAGEDVDTTLTVYRAIPKNAKDTKMRNGDWVSPLRSYAEDEGLGIQGGYKIIAETVDAAHLYFNGDSIAELGFDNGKGYAYRNTKNNRKLNDAVTRDENGNIVPLSKRFNARKEEEYFQDKDSPRGTFDPVTRAITLMPNSDLSTYLHESGHLYLEVMASLAAHETASEGLRADMDAALKWFGVKGENASERLAAWNAMTLEEKRNFHEKWAESFEQYLFEGVAPSPELREAFKNFRQWLTYVYKSMAQFLVGQKNAKLNDEMRGVFDRILASEEQINTMREARNMLPIFTVKPANITGDEWERYQKAAKDFAEESIEQLTSRSLRDMKWLSNAKNKTLRKLQREAAQARREARMEARTAVLGQPVYRAWQFLTAPVEGVVARNKQARSNGQVDTARDSLFTAIAKLGGLNKEEAVSQYGIDPKDFLRKGGVFGKPVLRVDGGLSPDAMAEALSQHNYLPLDEHGKWDIRDLEDLLREEAAGNPQYSTDVDMDVLLGEPQRAFFDAENVEYMGGRLNRIDIRNMFDDIQLAEMAGIDPFSGEKVADSAVLQGYNQKRKVEGGGNERQYVLFDEPGNDNAADKKRARRKGAPRNMESAERVPGRYTTTVKSEKTKEINAGFDLLDTPAKVAFATSSLSKSPQEVLFAVATDKNDKPIAILRHSLGMRNSASVDPGIVAGWAANVEGAANIWLSHNHPSGKSDLSNADKNISKIIGDILDGTGITNRGIIAVTHEGNYSWVDTSGSDETGSIPEPEKNKKVSVVEREFSSNGLLSDDYSDGVNNPADAIKMAKDIGGGEAGIVMLDAQYRPIGFMPINYTEANNARGKKLHKDIVRAIELSNANAVLHYSPDSGRAVEDGMLNIGALMDVANIQTIDAIVGGNTSLAGRDGILSSTTFQQNKKKKNKDPNAPRTLESMGVLSDDGIQPDLLADYFGFPSVEAMVKALLTAPDPVSAIKRLTDEIMVQRYADLATPQAIEQAALAALHSEAHSKFLATELAILNRAVGKPRLVMQAAKQYADRIVSALRIADLNPAQYEMQAAKAGKETEKLLGQNKTADAAMAKRNQILHDATARRVREERENVAKALRFFDRTEKAARNGKLRADVGAQVLTLLDSYDLRKGTTLKAAELADRSLAEFVQQQSEAMDMPMPSLADAVLRGGVKRSYKTMSVEEFNGLVDAVKYLEAVGRREYAMYKAVRDQSFAQERSAILDRLREYWPDAFDEEGNPLPTENAILKTGAYNAKKKARSVAHELLTPETVTNILEGGVFGQVHESLFARLSNAMTDRSILMKELHEKLQPFMDAYTWKERREFGKKDIGTAAIGEPLSRENALVVALLAGSKEGRDRLANYGWNDARIAQVVNLLDAKDIALANAIFDMFDNTLWPKLESLNKRTMGVSPPKVLPIALQAKNGTLTGGYFPIRYDGDMDARSSSFDDKQALDLMKNGIGLSAKTNQSSSQARVDGVKMRPLLSLSVMSRVAGETAHDISLREAVMDSARLLNNAEIAQGIQNIVGMEGWKSLKKNLGDIASPPHDAGGIFAGAANFARRNVVTALMSGVGTAVQNFTGLLPAFSRVHKGLLLKEIADVPNLIEKYKDTIEKSAYMRERFGKFERDLVNDVDKLGMKKGLMPDQSVWFAMMAWVDRAVSVPVWQAAYREGLAKGVDAVEYADHIVRQTQGGGRLIDRAPIMRGGALQQLFTMFYSYFNGQLNMVARDAALAKREVAQGEVSKAAARLAASAIFVWILPAVISELTRQAPDDEDDEEKLQRVVRATILYPTAMIPLLRDFAPFVYDKIAGNRAFDPRLTPVQGFVSTLSRAATAAGDIGSDDFDEKDFKALMMGVGFTFNLPAILFTDVVLGTKALLNGETDDIRAPLIGTAPSR